MSILSVNRIHIQKLPRLSVSSLHSSVSFASSAVSHMRFLHSEGKKLLQLNKQASPFFNTHLEHTPSPIITDLKPSLPQSSPSSSFSFSSSSLRDSGFCCSFHRFESLRLQRLSFLPTSSFSTSLPSSPALSDPVFSIETNNIRYGRGSLLELGPACMSLCEKGKAVRIALFTDQKIEKTEWFNTALENIKQYISSISPSSSVFVFSSVSIEPSSSSLQSAIDWCNQIKPDLFVSIGGGSVMDTAKASNLYSSFPPPDGDILAYVNPPIGRGLWPTDHTHEPSTGQLTSKNNSDCTAPRLLSIKLHIACPTTAGTGSESTGIAIFDFPTLGVKSGIAHKMLRPTMAIIDPTTQETVSKEVVACSGFDVMSHALESYTAIPHYLRTTNAKTPAERFSLRPMSQGRNSWAEHGCISALELMGQNMLSAYQGDINARDSMMMASTLAGVAFGNVGVHLPHAMSYAVSGGVEGFRPEGYEAAEGDIVPHGMAVILNAPSVMRHTVHDEPDRHLKAAIALGCDDLDSRCTDPIQIGEALSQRILSLMKGTGMPNGLNAVGFGEKDVGTLASGTMKQQRLLNNMKKPMDKAGIEKVFRGAMKYW